MKMKNGGWLMACAAEISSWLAAGTARNGESEMK